MKAWCFCLAACSLVFSLSAPAADAVVRWSSLKKLDELAEQCEALSEQKNTAALRKIAPEVKAAALVVAKDAVPGNAAKPAEVKVLQGDLKNLADAITDPSTQNGAELTTILAGVHPIVENLMEAAGMPHVHEDEAKDTPAAKAKP